MTLQQSFVGQEGLLPVIAGRHWPSSETLTLHMVGVLSAASTATNTITAIMQEIKMPVEAIVFVCLFLTIMLRFTSVFSYASRVLIYRNFALELFSM